MKSGSDFTQVLTWNEVVPLRDAWAVCYIIGYCLLLLSNGEIYLGNFYSSNGSQYQQKQLADCTHLPIPFTYLGSLVGWRQCTWNIFVIDVCNCMSLLICDAINCSKLYSV